MRILLTGFEPFGGSQVNPSEQVVKILANHPPKGIQISTAILPVNHQAGPKELLRALSDNAPEAIVCLGEAQRRSAISIERIAVNLLDFRIPDNQGVQVVDEPIVADGPAAYFVTLPVRKLMQGLKLEGIPAELSLSAGAYLCNQVLYILLDYLHQQNSIIPAGFIHLPALPEQAALAEHVLPSMSIETMTRGIARVLDVIKECQLR